MQAQADIFCRIIDNYGDLGVCWRLARQLAREFGVAVTLWVDDLETFAQLAPLDPTLPLQILGDIRVRHWRDDMAAPEAADIIIEGFACALPPGLHQAMQARERPPLWLNLEYLSAEDWVEDCHGLASTHPATGLVQHFWFPGFSERTGGLLREEGLLEARERFQLDREAHEAFWLRTGVPEALTITRRVSLFAYENAAIPGLLDALSQDQPTLLVVPVGRALGDVARWAGRHRLEAGDRIHQGSLTIAVLPLLAAEDYDRLLWACQLNAVRGEDSFVRAQWAGQPLLWHIYPQEADAHWTKLEAFMHRLERQVAVPAAWAEAQRAWNRGDPDPSVWSALLADLPQLAPPAHAWAAWLGRQKDLASGVMHFYGSRVE